MLINENILASYDYESPESVRFNRLWKNEVASIFKANEQLLQQLFKKMMRKKKYMSFDDAFKMVEKIEKPEQAQATGISQKDFT